MCRSNIQDAASFHAHLRGQRDTVSTAGFESQMTIYFPISAGEFVAEAWVIDPVNDGRLWREPILEVLTPASVILKARLR